MNLDIKCEPPCQMSRSEVTAFESYRTNTETDTYIPRTDCSSRTTKSAGNNASYVSTYCLSGSAKQSAVSASIYNRERQRGSDYS